MSELHDDRPEVPLIADERRMLDSWLEFHRATLAMKCAGLDADQLKLRSAEPSSLSLLGLVRHMADVERSWFRRVMEGEDAPPLYYTKTDRDGEFDNVDAADPDEAFATWHRECAEANKLVASRGLDEIVMHSQWNRSVSVRWIMVHMIEEYARHNGHADLLRERIDGQVGD